jgi:hypothetical protein
LLDKKKQQAKDGERSWREKAEELANTELATNFEDWDSIYPAKTEMAMWAMTLFRGDYTRMLCYLDQFQAGIDVKTILR